MNRIYRVIWNCTLQVFQACSELTRRAGKTSTVNLRKSSGLTTKFSRLTLGVLLALSGSASGASLEVDNDQITNIDTDVAYDAYLVGWYGTGVLNILAGGNASLTTITTSVIGANEDSEGTVNVLGGTWRLYDSGNNARPLNVGQSGTGTLNIKQKGHVDGGYLRLGSSTGGVGTVNVEGEDSVLTTELFEIGSYGTGSLNITDKGYVTSSIVAILGYQAGSNGQVVVEKGGEWLIKNNDSSIEFQIGNQGTGEATIREGGLVTAENTIIGGNATGIGTLNVQDQDSVITVRRLYNGYFGNGTVNISNNGLINNKEYSLVGVQDGSHGVVNVTDKGHWNFLGTGEAFRYIYIGDAGDGELNVSSEGKVDSGIITAGMKETGTGNITVKDKNSVITNLGTNLGYDGHGEMNISNQGLVVSNGGSSLGYGETGVGNVSITTGGMWEVNKNVYTTIGVAGVGNLNISDGGKFVSQNITFLGDKASGIGTLNLMDATSSFDTVGINVGNFGSGIVNVSNGATLNSTGYGFIGGNASGKGIVNISTDSLWNLKTSSTNAQLLQVGVLGKGELNITTGGIVKARDTQIALNDKSKGDVRVDGQNSLLETFNMYVGTSGTGTLTLTNNGTLNVEGGEVYLGVFEPAVGTLNIGAAHGEAAADAGFITNATKVEFGLGEGVFVFNHTNNSDAGYQVDMLITGDDKDGKVIHDAGHTVFNAGNTYSGKTLVNDGLLTIASHTADGVTGMGSSEVTIASPGTLDILASTNSAGDYTLTNALKGDGLMRVQLSSSDKMFGFTHATGTEFAGVAQLKDSTFTLERDNTAALTHAMLQSDSENTTSVKVGEQSIGGLAMNGGTIIFDTDIPAATLAEGYISVDTLVVGAGDYTWKGRNYQVNGTGDVLIDVPKPWNDPMANNPLTTLNLLEHDDSHVGVQLVKAQTVIGSGGSLTLRDLQGDEVEADKTLHIAQNGTVVAEGDYGFRLTTAPGDGLYVNYGLKALNIHGGQKLTLAEHGGAYGATADMSAKIGGEGDLAINTVRQVSLSNGQNDYQGATYVQMGTLRTDADGALGNTRELNISNAAIVDLNGSTQTVETFTGQMGSTVLFKEGALTVNKGGISQGELTGGGNLNVTGGTLAIEGLNARYNALTSISPNAEVSLDNTQGLGRGNIANDGLLTLKFDLLSEIGRDSVGAVTLIPEDETVTHPIMAWEKLTEARLEEVLTAYKADIPLGMIREENDFRISVAGAQEKTALLRIGNDWCIPKGITPTTHIIKLPIGEIRQPNATLDLSQSVDNEYYCLLLAKELGLNVPDAEIIKAGNVRALAVERFDRRWNAERTVLLRLPQEDMCQTFGLPSSVKYESDGGPGIARIMAFLMGSSEALKDRYDFMKFQVFQWLIGATDGHAKNFSVFIQAGGSYRLTPFYDIISAFPVLGGTGIHISDLKLAMGLNASKGKKTAIDKIYPRHFLATAKVLRFPEVQMHEILSDFARMIPAALDNVKTSLPTDFPENVVTAVESNVLRLHGRLSREYGSK